MRATPVMPGCAWFAVSQGFYPVRCFTRLMKFEGGSGGKSDVQIETAIKQIVDEALSSDRVIDIFNG